MGNKVYYFGNLQPTKWDRVNSHTVKTGHGLQTVNECINLNLVILFWHLCIRNILCYLRLGYRRSDQGQKLNKKMNGCKSRVKDCLQQSKIFLNQKRSIRELDISVCVSRENVKNEELGLFNIWGWDLKLC